MPLEQNSEPMTTAALVRKATVLLVRAAQLQNESDLLKRQTQELLRTARELHSDANRLTQGAPSGNDGTVDSRRYISDVMSRFNRVLTRPRHLFIAPPAFRACARDTHPVAE
jgi:hypothetical protein